MPKMCLLWNFADFKFSLIVSEKKSIYNVLHRFLLAFDSCLSRCGSDAFARFFDSGNNPSEKLVKILVFSPRRRAQSFTSLMANLRQEIDEVLHL